MIRTRFPGFHQFFGHRASPLPEGVIKIMRISTLAAFLIVWSATSLAETTNFVLSLDGSSYATIQDSANAQSDAQITVEAWVNPVGGGSLINKGDGQNGISQRSYELKWSEGILRFAIYFALPVTGSQPTFAEINTPIESGTWVHVAGSYGALTGLTIYTNGVPANASTTYDGNSFLGLKIRQTSLPLVFGSTPPFANTIFHGSLDEVRIWATAKTPQEIEANQFKRFAGTEPGLIGYWNFDAGTISDLSSFRRGTSTTGSPLIAPVAGLDVIHRFMRFQARSLNNGRFNAHIQSVPQIPLSIEVSNDLTTWEPFLSLTTPGDFEFTDGPVTNCSRRFYRTVSP